MIALVLYYAPSTQCTLSSDPPCSTYIFSVHSSITREITSFDDYNLTRNWEDREGRDVERGETQQSRVWSSFWSLCINEVWKEKSCRVLFLSFVCDVDCLREKLWHKRWSIDGIFEESARQKDWIIKRRDEGNHNVFTRRTRDEKKVVMAKKKKKKKKEEEAENRNEHVWHHTGSGAYGRAPERSGHELHKRWSQTRKHFLSHMRST